MVKQLFPAFLLCCLTHQMLGTGLVRGWIPIDSPRLTSFENKNLLRCLLGLEPGLASSASGTSKIGMRYIKL